MASGGLPCNLNDALNQQHAGEGYPCNEAVLLPSLGEVRNRNAGIPETTLQCRPRQR